MGNGGVPITAAADGDDVSNALIFDKFSDQRFWFAGNSDDRQSPFLERVMQFVQVRDRRDARPSRRAPVLDDDQATRERLP